MLDLRKIDHSARCWTSVMQWLLVALFLSACSAQMKVDTKSGGSRGPASAPSTEEPGTAESKAAKLTSSECIDPDLAKVSSDQSLMLCDGTIAKGTLTLDFCATDGQVGCVTVTTFPSASVSGLASKVLQGQKVAGVSGNVTLPAPAKVLAGVSYGPESAPVAGSLADRGTWDLTTAFPGPGYFTAVTGAPVAALRNTTTIAGTPGTLADCAADAATGCIAVAGFPAARIGTGFLHESNIRAGVQIGGVTGAFPSATYTLTGASSGVSDITSGNFNSMITGNSTFEWWGSDGQRHTGTGEVDLSDPTKIANGLSIFGTNGTLIGATACTGAGQTGCVTTSAFRSAKPIRNSAKSVTATVIYDNIIGPAAAGLDVYDTIDDYNDGVSGLPPDMPWGADYVASASNWVAGGTDFGSVAGLCNEAEDQCVYTDQTTGLIWSEQNTNLDFTSFNADTWPCSSDGCSALASGHPGTDSSEPSSYTAGADMNWWDALYACSKMNDLNFGGYSTGWRMPTQKELLQASINGIRAVESAHFILTHNLFWSSTTRSTAANSAWYVQLSNGVMDVNNKPSFSYHFVCVR